MRTTYVEICKLIVVKTAHIGSPLERQSLVNLIVNLNHSDSPLLDQDICDFLADLYIFVIWGYDHNAYPEGIRDLKHLRGRLEVLENN